ncbi:hypothetical protein NQZ68_008540 [Dissostichus eleginoides]|nr:hypothetical protein NQZ68_008540 [Dissostichus eleginoides]
MTLKISLNTFKQKINGAITCSSRGLNVPDSPSLLQLTSTANSLQLLILTQQDSSSQNSREEQLLNHTGEVLNSCPSKF